MDGVLDFYNRLYCTDYDQYNQHDVLCVGDDESVIGFTNFARYESFVPCYLKLNECSNVTNGDNVIIGECVATEPIPSLTDDTEKLFICFAFDSNYLICYICYY